MLEEIVANLRVMIAAQNAMSACVEDMRACLRQRLSPLEHPPGAATGT